MPGAGLSLHRQSATVQARGKRLSHPCGFGGLLIRLENSGTTPMQFQQQTRYLLFPPFLQHLGATAAAGWDQDSTDLFAEAWKARAKCLSKKGNKRHATSGVLVKAIRLNGHLDSLLAAWEKHASDAAALRVVMLIRDPRGLVTSRLRNGWYTVMIAAPCVCSNLSVANSL